MEVEIQSRKLVTPSPNNDHPRKLQLSCLDQLAPPYYVQCIFYYAAGEGGTQKEKLARMDKSLSETLTVFYSLAGRYVSEDLSIDCSDQGVAYAEARVEAELDELLRMKQPDAAKLLSRFVPPDLHHSPTTPLLSIQVNAFQCGGFAIGLQISHLVADGYTISLFLNEWASACRSGKITARPSFNLASIFPSRDIFAGSNYKPLPPPPRVENTITRRFVFLGKMISRLRVNEASRVQMVTALVWRSLIRVFGARASLLVHSFNLRGKINLPVPDNSCGNLYRLVNARQDAAGTCPGEFQELVGLVRGAIRNAVESAKASLGGDDIFSISRNAWRQTMLGMDEGRACVFTSWCRMCFYEVDFGWGKPCWMSPSHVTVERLVILIDTRDGDGIEAWVSLTPDKMLAFEQDLDIFAFALRHLTAKHPSSRQCFISNVHGSLQHYCWKDMWILVHHLCGRQCILMSLPFIVRQSCVFMYKNKF